MSARFLSFLLVLAAFTCLLLNGCSQQENRADLVFLNGTEPESLDPSVITGQPEERIVLALFEGLTAHDPKGRIVPGVAERWELSPDGKEYTFHLRSNARWSNGDFVTAQDFINSWRRTLTPSTASEYVYQLFYIQNAEAFYSGKITDFEKVGLHATDAHTLRIQLSHPTPFFLDLCAFPTLFPIHRKSVEQYGDEWIKPGHLISNGAYILQEWRINYRVRLRANPFYWDAEHVALKTIDILPTNQANTAFNLFYSGAADLILDKGLVPNMLLEDLRKSPHFHSSPFLGNYFYRFNVTREPFKDARVRKAFALAIDKQRIVDKITRAGELVADSLVPPGIPGYTPPQGLSYDPPAARKFLAEAGFSGGKDFPPISLLYNDSEQNKAIATEIQDMLQKNLGILVRLSQQEMKVYYNSMSRLDYDFCRASWVADYNDPNTFLDMFVTDGGNNRTGWSNPKYDELIRLAAQEVNPQRRMEIFREAETILCSEGVPILPLFYYVGIQFYDPNKLTGIEPNVLDEHPLKYIRKKN